MNERLIWAAGFFDGEGHSRVKPQKGKFTQSQIVIELSQRNRTLIGEFEKLFGGNVYPFTQVNGHICFKWYITGYKACLKPMAAMWPYLHDEKKNQFLLALNRAGVSEHFRAFIEEGYIAPL